MARLQAVCRDNKTEENLNNLADDLDPKDFALSPGQQDGYCSVRWCYAWFYVPV